ncbi:hypothetical protein [Rhizobium acaciae]|uniref:hypothetical protein n=1 Tax=Rhizobium acaciae TaxID=2989736 RepID=UPI00221FDEEE|nr:hypothetical protein [Rhizobium acaciae]MCW1749031.1 hypothetical protein [Rhizobium acaciae]
MEKPSVSSSHAVTGKIMPEQAGNRKSMPSVIVVYDLLKILEWEVFTFGGAILLTAMSLPLPADGSHGLDLR